MTGRTHVVFDFGGVVFSWRPQDIVSAALPGHASTPAAARALALDIFQHPDWHAFDRGTIAQADVVARAAERLGLSVDAVQALVGSIPGHLLPIGDTVRLLEALCRRREREDDVRLYYLSNMPAPFARALEGRHDFLRWFDGGIFSADVRLIKPQAEIFRLFDARFGLAGARTVFIDDLAANIDAARAHGWQGIHFRSADELAVELDAHLRGGAGTRP